MIYPSPVDMLRSIDATLVSRVEPSLKDLTGLSAIATIRHLVRLVRMHFEEGGKILAADAAALRALLPEVAAYLNALGFDNGEKEAAKIEAAMEESKPDPDVFRDYGMLANEVRMLRESLYQALKYLQGIRGECDGDEEYVTIRGKIREYIVWQVEQVEKLIAPAFYGQGPRR